MEHSPDGKAYLVGMGAEEHDPKPRPCITPGMPGEAFRTLENCTEDFAHANLSWITADQIYLARVKPSPETINDLLHGGPVTLPFAACPLRGTP